MIRNLAGKKSQHPFTRIYGEKHCESKGSSRKSTIQWACQGPGFRCTYMFIYTQGDKYICSLVAGLRLNRSNGLQIHYLIQFCIPRLSTKLIATIWSNFRPWRCRMCYRDMPLDSIFEVGFWEYSALRESENILEWISFENVIWHQSVLEHLRCTQRVTCVKFPRMHVHIEWGSPILLLKTVSRKKLNHVSQK